MGRRSDQIVRRGNGAVHIRNGGDYRTFCGILCEDADWVIVEGTLTDALNNKALCKRCNKIMFS